LANTSVPPRQNRPGTFKVLLLDCGPSAAGAAVVYPAAFVLLCRWLSGRMAEAGPDGSLPAAMAAGSLGLLAFLGPLWLTGPRALICRMVVFIVLGGAVLLGNVVETFASGAYSLGFETVRDEATGAPRPGAFALTAISIGFLLVLFAVTRAAMVFSAGRAGQYAAAVLVGAAMTTPTAFISAALKNADSLEGKRAVVAWFHRLSPTIAAYETVEYTTWRTHPDSFYREAGEQIINIQGSPGEGGSAAKQPSWRQTALLLTVGGAGLWLAAAVVAFVRNRIASLRSG
jgi:hypothetical protein